MGVTGRKTLDTNSPWGEVQKATRLAPGVWRIYCASHGGIVVDRSVGRRLLSLPALAAGDLVNGRYYFEEDCEAPLVLHERPEWGEALRGDVSAEDFADLVTTMARAWFPSFFKYKADPAVAQWLVRGDRHGRGRSHAMSCPGKCRRCSWVGSQKALEPKPKTARKARKAKGGA